MKKVVKLRMRRDLAEREDGENFLQKQPPTLLTLQECSETRMLKTPFLHVLFWSWSCLLYGHGFDREVVFFKPRLAPMELLQASHLAPMASHL